MNLIHQALQPLIANLYKSMITGIFKFPVDENGEGFYYVHVIR